MNTVARDEEIAAFLFRWYPYGGGAEEDIATRFGLSERQYFTHAAAIIAALGEEVGYTEAELVAMQRICRQRLWVAL